MQAMAAVVHSDVCDYVNTCIGVSKYVCMVLTCAFVNMHEPALEYNVLT